MRGTISIAALAAAIAIAGCGGSSGGTSSSGAGTAQSAEAGAASALRAFFAAGRPCPRMTPHGRDLYVKLYGPNACRAHRPLAGAAPRIAPVGARGDLALAYYRGSGRHGGGFAVLRRPGGRWLVDFPGPLPIPPGVRAPGVPSAFREPLPTTGPSVRSALGAASRYTDAHVARGSARVHVAAVALVGDVAIAYQVAGSDVPGNAAAPATAGLNDVLLLTRGPHGWRVLHPGRLAVG